MNESFSHKMRSRAFTLIELASSVLLFSFMALTYTNYLKKNQNNLRSSDSQGVLQSSASVVQKLLSEDLRQTAYFTPSCIGNPGLGTATTPCTDMKIFGGYTPLPGTTKTAVNAISNFGLPNNIADAQASLSESSDSLRIVVYDLSSAYNCKLNSYRASNPSTTAGNGGGAERLWPLRSGCGNLAVGKLYVLMESSGTEVFGNIFQITALTDLGGGATSVDQLQVDAASTGNLYNQVGGLGLSGFSSAARIFPVKLIEWSKGSDGIYRREVKPSATDLAGYGTWKMISDAVEDIQLYPVTVTATTATEHQRSMQFTGDTKNNGVEDIKGVNVRLVVKSKAPSNDAMTYDNPLTTAVEADHFPREEIRFYVDFKNSHTGS